MTNSLGFNIENTPGERKQKYVNNVNVSTTTKKRSHTGKIVFGLIGGGILLIGGTTTAVLLNIPNTCNASTSWKQYTGIFDNFTSSLTSSQSDYLDLMYDNFSHSKIRTHLTRYCEEAPPLPVGVNLSHYRNYNEICVSRVNIVKYPLHTVISDYSSPEVFKNMYLNLNEKRLSFQVSIMDECYGDSISYFVLFKRRYNESVQMCTLLNKKTRHVQSIQYNFTLTNCSVLDTFWYQHISGPQFDNRTPDWINVTENGRTCLCNSNCQHAANICSNTEYSDDCEKQCQLHNGQIRKSEAAIIQRRLDSSDGYFPSEEEAESQGCPIHKTFIGEDITLTKKITEQSELDFSLSSKGGVKHILCGGSTWMVAGAEIEIATTVSVSIEVSFKLLLFGVPAVTSTAEGGFEESLDFQFMVGAKAELGLNIDFKSTMGYNIFSTTTALNPVSGSDILSIKLEGSMSATASFALIGSISEGGIKSAFGAGAYLDLGFTFTENTQLLPPVVNSDLESICYTLGLGGFFALDASIGPLSGAIYAKVPSKTLTGGYSSSDKCEYKGISANAILELNTGAKCIGEEGKVCMPVLE